MIHSCVWLLDTISFKVNWINRMHDPILGLEHSTLALRWKQCPFSLSEIFYCIYCAKQIACFFCFETFCQSTHTHTHTQFLPGVYFSSAVRYRGIRVYSSKSSVLQSLRFGCMVHCIIFISPGSSGMVEWKMHLVVKLDVIYAERSSVSTFAMRK